MMAEAGAEREIASLSDALTLLDEWIAAYEELRIEHVRLMHRYIWAQRHLEHAYDALDHYVFLATLPPLGCDPNAEKEVSRVT